MKVKIYDIVENRVVEMEKWAADVRLRTYPLSKPGGRYCLPKDISKYVNTPPPSFVEKVEPTPEPVDNPDVQPTAQPVAQPVVKKTRKPRKPRV